MIKKNEKDRGFTLIEVIITIIIAAMVGVVVFTYLGNTLARSVEPLNQVRDLAEAIEDMEEITAIYQSYQYKDIDWNTFLTSLPETGVWNRRGASGTDFSTDDSFDIIEVTITRNNHSVSAIFTE